ncbi:MAG: hypothetical protein H6601_02210 [Flavobacteriales bacterium]|nr:hypothetical protein [Flavobacteriales bacterium]
MKNSKAIYWLLVVIGTIALFSSLFMFSEGKPFMDYFWGGFCGAVLIGTASIQLKEKKGKE